MFSETYNCILTGFCPRTFGVHCIMARYDNIRVYGCLHWTTWTFPYQPYFLSTCIIEHNLHIKVLKVNVGLWNAILKVDDVTTTMNVGAVMRTEGACKNNTHKMLTVRSGVNYLPWSVKYLPRSVKPRCEF